MRFFPRFRDDTAIEIDDRQRLSETMKRAEMVTHAQEHLTKLVEEGKYKEFVRYATGVYPADIAADRRLWLDDQRRIKVN